MKCRSLILPEVFSAHKDGTCLKDLAVHLEKQLVLRL